MKDTENMSNIENKNILIENIQSNGNICNENSSITMETNSGTEGQIIEDAEIEIGEDFYEDLEDVIIPQSLESEKTITETVADEESEESKGSLFREVVYLDNQHLANGEKFDFSIYRPLTMSNWFTTFMFMNVPIFGLLYLLFLAIFSKQALKKDFARAYLLYQLIFYGIAIVIVGLIAYLGIEMLDNAIKFMQEL